MSEIDYRVKYDKLSLWVAKVVGQSNELYQTLNEHISMLTEDNGQLRTEFDKMKIQNALLINAVGKDKKEDKGTEKNSKNGV